MKKFACVSEKNIFKLEILTIAMGLSQSALSSVQLGGYMESDINRVVISNQVLQPSAFRW